MFTRTGNLLKRFVCVVSRVEIFHASLQPVGLPIFIVTGSLPPLEEAATL
jgi:hypothetical protein